MTEDDWTGSVAADTNLIRHPTPRRYLTALEDLRGRRVAILPMVYRELNEELYSQAVGYIRKLCRRDGIERMEDVQAATQAAGEAALEWWEGECCSRNESSYTYVPDRGKAHYRRVVAALPTEAFTDTRDGDLWIYAQAWAHGIDVLASRNRRTVIRERLERHFSGLGLRSPPVMVRGLYEHTAIVAENEDRYVSDVALDAVLGAVIPNAWTPEKSERVLSSCMLFANNLATMDGRGVPVASEENDLAHGLNEAICEIDGEDFVRRCEKAYASRPTAARETELRYHRMTRAAVRETGIDLWG